MAVTPRARRVLLDLWTIAAFPLSRGLVIALRSPGTVCRFFSAFFGLPLPSSLGVSGFGGAVDDRTLLVEIAATRVFYHLIPVADYLETVCFVLYIRDPVAPASDSVEPGGTLPIISAS